MDKLLRCLRTAVKELLVKTVSYRPADLDFNSVNINYYPSGRAALGWHADDEDLFPDENGNTVIASLSLGTTRCFELKEKTIKIRRTL